jgi:hypothetical protein
MTRDHRFSHRKSGRIEYHEEDGNIWFSYKVSVAHPHIYNLFHTQEVADIIPESVIQQGKEAVRTYAKEQVKKHFTEKETASKNNN